MIRVGAGQPSANRLLPVPGTRNSINNLMAVDGGLWRRFGLESGSCVRCWTQSARIFHCFWVVFEFYLHRFMFKYHV